MEHHINIEETINLVPTEPKIAHPNVVQSIKKKLEQVQPLFPESCIFRVHKGLRMVNPKAYTPMLLSIGPYHFKNCNPCVMKEHKLRYLHSFLERRKENSIEKYISKLEELEDRARKCYVNPTDYISSDEFVEMMLLDGCFIIEFFLRTFTGLIDKDDPIFNVTWMVTQICCDMLLLENQLPYFVLSKLYDITIEDLDHEMPLMEKALEQVFTRLLPMPCRPDCLNNTPEIKHLVHLVHALFHPPSELTSLEGNTKDNNEILEQMRSVVELQDAGVKFKKAAGEVSLFDIKFNNGLMEIPSFNANDSTDTVFRNLIAYEQHSSDVECKCKYFTDYTSFMDELINSEKDVNLLRLNGIIVNLLGDDDKVSQLFNRLGDGVVDSCNFYYFEVCNKVNTHCKKRWNVVMATLRHTYFNNPWAGVSTVAVGVLLILALLQTIAALLDLS